MWSLNLPATSSSSQSQYRLSSNLCGLLRGEMTRTDECLNTASAVTFVVQTIMIANLALLSQYRLSSNLCGQEENYFVKVAAICLNTASAVTFVVNLAVDKKERPYYVSIPPQQ